MTPKVSVIIPVYNVEAYLQACIDSLVCQTLQDIELIFINDASTDGSLLLLEQNKAKYPDKIMIIDSKENLRQGGARNLGIRAAKAPYIGFVDSDDFVAADMYETLYDRITANEADAAIIQAAFADEQGAIISVDTLGNPKPYLQWHPNVMRKNGTPLTDAGRMDLMCYPIGGLWAGLWKRSIIVENALYFPEKLRYEDNYWAGLMRCYLNKVCFVDKVCYFYRQRSASTVHEMNATHHFDRIKIENSLLTEAKARGLLTRYEPAFEYLYIQRYALNTFYTLLYRFTKPHTVL